MTAVPLASAAGSNWNQAASVWGNIGTEKQNILLPAIAAQILAASARGHFQPTQDIVLDFGCGDATIGGGLLELGIKLDGVDTSPAMVEAAKAKIAALTLPSSLRDFLPKITVDYSDLSAQTYGLGLVCFVHQCAPTIKELGKMFKDVASRLKNGAPLLLLGAHPDPVNLADPHATCEYYPKAGIRDGDTYAGKIFLDTGGEIELSGEVYWRLETLAETLQSVGFKGISIRGIQDVSSPIRPAGKTPPFFLMSGRLERTLERAM